MMENAPEDEDTNTYMDFHQLLKVLRQTCWKFEINSSQFHEQWKSAFSLNFHDMIEFEHN